LQGKVPKEIDAILTEALAYFLSGRAKDLSAPLQERKIFHTNAFPALQALSLSLRVSGIMKKCSKFATFAILWLYLPSYRLQQMITQLPPYFNGTSYCLYQPNLSQ